MTGLEKQLLDIDWLVLRDVARFRLLTGRQLQRLHFGTTDASARAARRCLQRLHRHKLLLCLQRRVGGVRAGSDGYVYALSTLGDRLLAHVDHRGDDGTPRAARRRRSRDVTDGFLDHTLGVAEVYVRLAVAARIGGLQLRHVEAEPQCWRRLDTGAFGESDWLKPDLLVAVTTPANEFHSFVELDRGTEHRPALLRKLRQYELAYRLGVVAIEAMVFPRVVWLVPNAARARMLSELIANSAQLTPELHAIALQEHAFHALTGDSLHVTVLPGPVSTDAGPATDGSRPATSEPTAGGGQPGGGAA